MDLPKMYSTALAAELLGLAQITVRDMCRDGRLPCNRRNGRFVITEEQLVQHVVGKPYEPKTKK
jgi:predicted site-specific integrase-resolvase